MQLHEKDIHMLLEMLKILYEINKEKCLKKRMSFHLYNLKYL